MLSIGCNSISYTEHTEYEVVVVTATAAPDNGTRSKINLKSTIKFIIYNINNRHEPKI